MRTEFIKFAAAMIALVGGIAGIHLAVLLFVIMGVGLIGFSIPLLLGSVIILLVSVLAFGVSYYYFISAA